MTNVESYLSTAIEAKEAGKLTAWEANFIDSIVAQYGTDKKGLKGLSSKQFDTLRSIARKF
jgi:hypothetical protein